MPVFEKQLRLYTGQSPQEAIREMAKHIRYIQEQLEYTLFNLDSSNITEIETDVTNITSSSGEVSISGSRIELTGSNGEAFIAGKNANGKFEFALKGKNGTQHMYLSSDGMLVLTKNASVSIDGGEW